MPGRLAREKLEKENYFYWVNPGGFESWVALQHTGWRHPDKKASSLSWSKGSEWQPLLEESYGSDRASSSLTSSGTLCAPHHSGSLSTSYLAANEVKREVNYVWIRNLSFRFLAGIKNQLGNMCCLGSLGNPFCISAVEHSLHWPDLQAQGARSAEQGNHYFPPWHGTLLELLPAESHRGKIKSLPGELRLTLPWRVFSTVVGLELDLSGPFQPKSFYGSITQLLVEAELAEACFPVSWEVCRHSPGCAGPCRRFSSPSSAQLALQLPQSPSEGFLNVMLCYWVTFSLARPAKLKQVPAGSFRGEPVAKPLASFCQKEWNFSYQGIVAHPFLSLTLVRPSLFSLGLQSLLNTNCWCDTS